MFPPALLEVDPLLEVVPLDRVLLEELPLRVLEPLLLDELLELLDDRLEERLEERLLLLLLLRTIAGMGVTSSAV